MAKDKPWVTGPYEILHHGLQLLKKDGDTNRRLAIILIDNAVEQMIKTFLSLPERVNGIKISRARREEFAENFPKMLDALEEFAVNKLTDIDLGMIEWHHRQRNQLYHEGFGLTVSKESVDIYAFLAISLFKNLFGVELVEKKEIDDIFGDDKLNYFLKLWQSVARKAVSRANEVRQNDPPKPMSIQAAIGYLADVGIISPVEQQELVVLSVSRNQIVHAMVDPKSAVSPELLKRLEYYNKLFGKDNSEPPESS